MSDSEFRVTLHLDHLLRPGSPMSCVFPGYRTRSALPLSALLLLALAMPAFGQRQFSDGFEGLPLCQQVLGEGPITAHPTAVAAFFGQPARVPSGVPGAHEIESFDAYRQLFALPGDASGRADGTVGDGGVLHLTGDNTLAWSVYLFFENGGRRAWVVPTAGPAPEWHDIERIDGVADIELLLVPALSGIVDDAERGAAVERLQQHVQRRWPVQDRYLLADLPRGWTTAQLPPALPRPPLDLVSRNAALYHPWLRVQSVLPGGAEIAQPPAGAIAGVYARIGDLAGVWESHAGSGADVRGIVALDQLFNNAQNQPFNDNHVNLIRDFDKGGILVWAQRTRALGDPEWRFVPVRRLAMMIDRSIFHGTRFAAFETNDPSLWTRLATRIDQFLHDLFVAGAFAGSTPEQAYFVRVDATTTTQADIQSGTVGMQYGIAPLQPAEFIIELLPQRAGICP